MKCDLIPRLVTHIIKTKNCQIFTSSRGGSSPVAISILPNSIAHQKTPPFSARLPNLVNCEDGLHSLLRRARAAVRVVQVLLPRPATDPAALLRRPLVRSASRPEQLSGLST